MSKSDNYNVLESQRREALNNQNAPKYTKLCAELGMDYHEIEDSFLYEKGLVEIGEFMDEKGETDYSAIADEIQEAELDEPVETRDPSNFRQPFNKLVPYVNGLLRKISGIRGVIEVKTPDYVRGTGYRNNLDYIVEGQRFSDSFLDDKEMENSEILSDGLNNLVSYMEPEEVTLDSQTSDSYKIIFGNVGAIRASEEAEKAKSIPLEEILSNKELEFFEAAKDINGLVPRMREALQEYSSVYRQGGKSDRSMGAASATKVRQSFHRVLENIKVKIKQGRR